MLDGSKKMKKLSEIPDYDNVLRYANKSRHLKIDHNGQIYGCFPALFELLAKDKGCLSVNWVEFFDGKPDEQIMKCIADFTSGFLKDKNKKLPSSSAFAKLNVGKFKEICKNYNAKIRVVHDKKGYKSKSHSSVTKLPQDNAFLFDDLCRFAFSKIIPMTKLVDKV
jgi:hypothetical protein